MPGSPAKEVGMQEGSPPRREAASPGTPSKASLASSPVKPLYVPPRNQPLPFPLVWLLIASLSAVTVLCVAHSALTDTGRSRGRARRLLQRPPGAKPLDAAALHADQDPEQQQPGRASGDSAGDEAGDGGGAGGQGSEQRGSRSHDAFEELVAGITPEGGSSSGSGGQTPAGSGDGRQPAPDARQRLAEGADLATFAAPGTHCVVTPALRKVALLFLTHGDLPHDALWTDWMRQAGGLLPRASLAGPEAFCLKQCAPSGTCTRVCGAAAACNPLCVDAMRRRLGAGRSPSVLAQQSLFSLYVHARPTLKDYPDGSVFQGRLIPDRIVAKWGTHALAAAAKRLVEAAVLDRANERFVLVGDTTVPLYHPTLMWQQLMADPRSRLDACLHSDGLLMRRRYNPVAMSSDRFKPDRHWRKSSQWFALNRKHAELMAADREVVSLFAQHCSVAWDAQMKKHRDCISDEHYLPSLLAMHGLDNETTCDITGGTFASWEEANDTLAGGHPKLYQPTQISAELFAEIRGAPGHTLGVMATAAERASCAGWAAATAAAQRAFFNATASEQATCADTLGSAEFLQQDAFAEAALGPTCALLARKFSPGAGTRVHDLYRSCTAALGVLPCDQELTAREGEWWSRR